MTTTWGRTLGAALVAAALALAAPPARAQDGPPPRRPRPSHSLPPLPVTQMDTRGSGTAAEAEAPRQAPAAAATPLAPVPATQLDERLPASRTGQNFSLSFSAPQPIRDVLLLMLKDTGLSVVIDPDAAGTFTGELANVTLKQALDITLQPLGLAYTLENKVLHVFRRPTETRFFSVNYVATRRAGERTTPGQPEARGATAAPLGEPSGAASGAGRGGITSADGADFYDELSNTVRALLSEAGRFTVDRKAGLVQVTDYPDRLDRVSRYLELAELRATRQVQIEATFVEVDLNGSAEAGIDWNAVLQAVRRSGKTPGSQRSAQDIGFALGVQAGDLDLLLKTLGTQGSVTVLARPRVTAMNNEPAVIRASTERTSAVVGASGAEVGEKADRGRRAAKKSSPALADAVVLTVTPQISGDGIIHMSVAPALARQTSAGASRHDAVTVSGADTVVRVREGETVVLGGLMHAALGPGPGMAGRDRANDAAAARPAVRTELVILLTPRVI